MVSSILANNRQAAKSDVLSTARIGPSGVYFFSAGGHANYCLQFGICPLMTAGGSTSLTSSSLQHVENSSNDPHCLSARKHGVVPPVVAKQQAHPLTESSQLAL